MWAEEEKEREMIRQRKGQGKRRRAAEVCVEKGGEREGEGRDNV